MLGLISSFRLASSMQVPWGLMILRAWWVMPLQQRVGGGICGVRFPWLFSSKNWCTYRERGRQRETVVFVI